ncbi:hypothetical protein Pmar_PMAR010274, partial [Perkinsus marinus ATCC 50983]
MVHAPREGAGIPNFPPLRSRLDQSRIANPPEDPCDGRVIVIGNCGELLHLTKETGGEWTLEAASKNSL